jgi:mRNA interferase RelE/StbE
MSEVLLHPDAQNVYANADKALAKKIARYACRELQRLQL